MDPTIVTSQFDPYMASVRAAMLQRNRRVKPMLTSLHSAHLTETPETVSTMGWIAQRILIVAAAVVFSAPFIIGYVGH
jgi:hypothetical protein